MARKPAKTPPPKPKTEKSQAERFKETARRLGVDETGETFERAFAKLVPAKGAGGQPETTAKPAEGGKLKPRRDA